MYNEVVDYLREWIDGNDDTVLIGTADHECGGLTLGGIVTTGEYQYVFIALYRALMPRPSVFVSIPCIWC